MNLGMGRRAILAEVGEYSEKISRSWDEVLVR